MKEKKVLAVRPKGTTIVGKSPAEVIQSVLASKGATIETLREMLAFQKEYEANEARKAYYRAMAAFKKNLPQINRNKKVNYSTSGGVVNYSYATLFNAIDKVTPIMSEFGLSVAWFQKQGEHGLTVTCRITHELGYSEETSLTALHDETGAKNKIQALGSTDSYLKRYTFFALIGTAAKDDDDDGRKAGPIKDVEKISDKQLSQLLDLIDNNKVSKPKFLAYLKVPALEVLTKDRFEYAMTALNNIIKAGNP